MGFISAVTGQATGGIATITITDIAVPANADYAVFFVAARGSDANTAFSSITLGGVAFTYDSGTMRRWNGSFGAAAMGYMLAADIPDGTVSAEITRSGVTNGMSFAVGFFEGIAQQAPEVIQLNAALAATTVSTNITSLTANALLIDCVQTNGIGDDYSPDGAQTTIAKVTTSGQSNALLTSYKAMPTAGATSMSWSNATSRDHAQVVFSLATADAAPSFTDGPAASSILDSGFNIDATSSDSGTASLIVTSAAASQPLDAAFDASTETATITAATPFSIEHTGETGGELRKAWVQLADVSDNRATASVMVLVPQAGFSTVVIGTPNTTADNRLTASPDISSGDTVSWGNIQGAGAVVVNDDATFTADAAVTAFDIYVGNTTDGWGTVATQTIGDPDTTAPTLTAATVNAAGDTLTLEFDEIVDVGSGGSGGFTLGLSAGAATLTYSSGDGSDELIYAISRTVYPSEIGELQYGQPGDGVEDAAGNDLESFDEFAVTNSSLVNHPPSNISLSKSSVRVDAGLNAVVGTLSTTDADPGDSFTYTLVAGTGDTDNASFSINGNQLLCDDPGTLGAGAYSVRIQTSDGTDTYAEAFGVTVAEPGTSAFTLTRNLTGPLCRPLTRSLAR